MIDKKISIVKQLWIIIGLSLLIHFSAVFAGATFLQHWSGPNQPLHAAVETVGSVVALFVALFLLHYERFSRGTDFNVQIAGALIGMGLADGFHAVVEVGNSFVWLHSTATFIGGLLFLTLYLPKTWPIFKPQIWPLLVFITTVLFCSASLFFADSLPAMVVDGKFSDIAIMLNVIGGAMLFAALPCLLMTYSKTSNTDTLLFFLHCSLFGAAAVMFQQSQLWDVSWWGWHVLRLMAYVVALWFIVRDENIILLELESHRNNLTELVDQRTHQLLLAQQEAEAQTIRAESAAKTKADFLANMSHEIRTPMNAVIGLTGRLMKTSLSAQQHNYLVNIERSAETLLAVINDILDFSKIEAGKLTLENNLFKFDELINRVVAINAVNIQEKNVEFLVWSDPEIPTQLKGDALRLSQVLINLISNASKFTERGYIGLKVSLLNKSADFVELRFVVDDSGIGIAPAAQQSLFDAFTQADNSTTRRFGGTGLGLSICKRLVVMMGGEFHLDSQLGKGSSFQFCIRFSYAEDGQNTESVSKDFSNINALVVDDCEYSRGHMQALLASFSIASKVVASGLEALHELETAAEPYQLILLDQKMPGLDGVETAKRMATIQSSMASSILMITTCEDEDLRDSAKRVGINKVLSKPIVSSDLLNAILALEIGSSEKAGETSVEAAATSYTVAAAWWEDGRFSNKTVLLVEDNKINQVLATELLEDANIIVVLAADGQQALEALHKHTFDAVLMDVQMPIMDGYEATAAIRAMPEYSQLPIIAMTAHACAEDVVKAKKMGMNDHISKPIDIEKMFATLARYLLS